MDATRLPFSIQSQPLKGPASSFVKRSGTDRPERVRKLVGCSAEAGLRPSRPCLLTTGLAARLLKFQRPIKWLCIEHMNKGEPAQ